MPLVAGFAGNPYRRRASPYSCPMPSLRYGDAFMSPIEDRDEMNAVDHAHH